MVSIDALKRRVTVGPREELLRREMRVADVHWLGGPPAGPVRAAVQVRHRHPAAAARIEPDGPTGARVTFDAAERALTPGQAAVFYQDDAVLGGGWIQ